MATLRKNDLVARIAKKGKTSKAGASSSVNAVLNGIREAVAGGNRVVLTGFGTFEVRQVKERKVRSIRGGTVTVRAHKRIGFRPGEEMARAAAGRKR